MSIYKSFIRPHLDYAYIIYDQPHYQSLSDRIESVQYNAALAITGSIRGASRERLYQELGLESLSNRQWYRRLTMFFNIGYRIIDTELLAVAFAQLSCPRVPITRSHYVNKFLKSMD